MPMKPLTPGWSCPLFVLIITGAFASSLVPTQIPAPQAADVKPPLLMFRLPERVTLHEPVSVEQEYGRRSRHYRCGHRFIVRA